MTVAKLLDSIKEVNSIRSDAELARVLDVAPPVISKLRGGTLALGPSMIVKMHLAFDVPVRELQVIADMDAEIRELVAA